MNITDYRHLSFSRIPADIVDACARAAFDREIANSGMAPCTDEEWARPSGSRAWSYLVRGLHREARLHWREEQPIGQAIIDAIIRANALTGARANDDRSVTFIWSAAAAEQIEAALREAGWKLTPL